MSTWNFMDPSSKETLLDLIRREADGMFALVATDEAWDGSTAAGAWTAANVVGHLIDVTEGYFVGFDAARAGASSGGCAGTKAMQDSLDEGARHLRSIGPRRAGPAAGRRWPRMVDIFAAPARRPDGRA